MSERDTPLTHEELSNLIFALIQHAQSVADYDQKRATQYSNLSNMLEEDLMQRLMNESLTETGFEKVN